MGPLAGLKIIEMAGVGPAPFAGMLLADMGADVVRIDRKPTAESDAFDGFKGGGFLDRGRRSIALDLKKPEAVAAALELVAGADALIEGFRPGVMERLGLGPEVCLARNPAWSTAASPAGARRAAGGDRRPRHQLHRADRRAARDRRPRMRRSRRSTSSATSAAARCFSPSASSARSSRRGARGADKSSTRR